MIGISTKTIYAVAALYELDNAEGRGLLKIKEIATRAKVPRSFLEQILLTLKKEGILASLKGANGGYKLAKDLKEITLKQIINALENDAFNDVTHTKDPALSNFWKDRRKDIEEAFAIPLSELRRYRSNAAKVLNFSI